LTKALVTAKLFVLTKLFELPVTVYGNSKGEFTVSYDENTDRMNWKNELSWLAISIGSGLLLSVLFIYFDKYSDANDMVIYTICCIGFYLLSILVRAQNHRGKMLTGKTGVKEKYLKYFFPLLGFGIGFAILFLN
jgi:hypothetical protein